MAFAPVQTILLDSKYDLIINDLLPLSRVHLRGNIMVGVLVASPATLNWIAGEKEARKIVLRRYMKMPLFRQTILVRRVLKKMQSSTVGFGIHSIGGFLTVKTCLS